MRTSCAIQPDAAGTHEDSRTGAMQGGDFTQAENGASGERPSLGTDVGASDGLPSQRLLPDGHGPEAGERFHRPAATNVGEVDRAVPSFALAGWNSDTPGDRSAAGGNKTGRLCH